MTLVLIVWIGGLTAIAAALRGMRMVSEAAWAAAIATGDMKPVEISSRFPPNVTTRAARVLAVQRGLSGFGWLLTALLCAATAGGALSRLFV